jgi:anhydro-N-acetylmuramic acid kinase
MLIKSKNMDSGQIYKVVGLMSGTSLDGLDVAYCTFKKTNMNWKYTIHKAVTIKYSSTWIKNLANAHSLSGESLIALDAAYGKLLGDICNTFIKKHKLKVDFIASHGHTIYHQPKRGFTFQLGNGHALHAASGLPVIYDFRTMDVAFGGEGAPLVPAGDKFLFNEFDVCLNLGGIANLSCEEKGKRIAFDICFVNMGLNYLASKANKTFDSNGDMASSGTLNLKMLQKLNSVYAKLKIKRPSLGRELFDSKIKPLLDDEQIPLEDRLNTFATSAAQEIVSALPASKNNIRVLCTGGGAFNSFLIYALLEKCSDNVSFILPDEDIIKFKEALIFAFLGVLRLRGENNCLRSVTGASRDCSGGLMIGF